MLYYKDDFVQIHHGHALEVLKQMPGESVDMVLTSPPYWGLRTYKTEPIIWGDNHCEHAWVESQHIANKSGGYSEKQHSNAGAWNPDGIVSNHGFCLKCNAWRGELGLEPTSELYIQHLILIFNEVKRVLKKTGTCWVNIDDSYAGGGNNRDNNSPISDKQASNTGATGQCAGHQKNIGDIGIPAKSLCLIPQRFAIAMVENGWMLRNDIVWHKPNPMPESVKDRFTGSWEHLFFFIKNNRALYWTNSKTFRITDKQPLGIHGVENEDWEWIEHSACQGKGCNNKRCVNGKIKSSLWEGHDYWFEQQFEKWTDTNIHDTKRAGQYIKYDGKWGDDKSNRSVVVGDPLLGRNKRDVWTIPTAPYPEAHFATFPEKLCETPILAGCPSAICIKCGKAREKIYKPTGNYIGQGGYGSKTAIEQGVSPTSSLLTKQVKEQEFIGYTDCGCNAGFEPGVTLDPFCGSGAALAAAKKLGRKGIGIDLNPKYCGLTVKRLEKIPLPMF